MYEFKSLTKRIISLSWLTLAEHCGHVTDLSSAKPLSLPLSPAKWTLIAKLVTWLWN